MIEKMRRVSKCEHGKTLDTKHVHPAVLGFADEGCRDARGHARWHDLTGPDVDAHYPIEDVPEKPLPRKTRSDAGVKRGPKTTTRRVA